MDQLIKEIYKSYVDMKTSQFNELDKDVLLDNIKELYSEVKNYPTNKAIVTDLSQQNTVEESNIVNSNEDSVDIVEPEVKVTETISQNDNIIEDNVEVTESIPEDSAPEIEVTETIEQNDNIANDEIVVDETIIEEVEPELIEATVTPTPDVDDTHEDIENTNVSNPMVDDTISVIDAVDSDDDMLEFEVDSKPIKSQENIVTFLKDESTRPQDIYDMIDINTRIGLVEIFFKGDSLALSESLSQINRLDSKDKAITILNRLAEKYNVKPEDDIYQTFLNLVNRRFK